MASATREMAARWASEPMTWAPHPGDLPQRIAHVRVRSASAVERANSATKYHGKAAELIIGWDRFLFVSKLDLKRLVR